MEQLKLGCPSLLGKESGILRRRVFCRLLVGVQLCKLLRPSAKLVGRNSLFQLFPVSAHWALFSQCSEFCKKQNSEFLRFNPGGEGWIIPVSSWIRPKQTFVPLLRSGKCFPVHRPGVGNLGQVTCCKN